VRANLKAQTGCDEWCTFCIIPTTRGPLKSLDAEEIVAQAQAKVSAGAREIILTGVHLGKFGFDEGKGDAALVSLLERLLSIDGLARLRLSSILCRHLTKGLLDLMASEPRLCRFLHVPLQSGDDSVLEAMHRPYSASEYRDYVGTALEQLPGLALATDIIVGFPGEDEAAFQETRRMVEDLRFSKLHVFRYSARPDTAAADLPDRVPDDVKKRRSKALIELGNDIRRQWLLSHVPGPVQVLVEDERMVDGVLVSSGQTDDHVRVWFEGAGMLGHIVDVVGAGIRADGLRGELISYG
jgi:threonylcarbamoyladenosine tRNA methylthiotransferase MtaB